MGVGLSSQASGSSGGRLRNLICWRFPVAGVVDHRAGRHVHGAVLTKTVLEPCSTPKTGVSSKLLLSGDTEGLQVELEPLHTPFGWWAVVVTCFSKTVRSFAEGVGVGVVEAVVVVVVAEAVVVVVVVVVVAVVAGVAGAVAVEEGAEVGEVVVVGERVGAVEVVAGVGGGAGGGQTVVLVVAVVPVVAVVVVCVVVGVVVGVARREESGILSFFWLIVLVETDHYHGFVCSVSSWLR